MTASRKNFQSAGRRTIDSANALGQSGLDEWVQNLNSSPTPSSSTATCKYVDVIETLGATRH